MRWNRRRRAGQDWRSRPSNYRQIVIRRGRIERRCLTRSEDENVCSVVSDLSPCVDLQKKIIIIIIIILKENIFVDYIKLRWFEILRNLKKFWDYDIRGLFSIFRGYNKNVSTITLFFEIISLNALVCNRYFP